MTDLTVIVVNWNTRHLLDCCLRSVARQTADVELQVIVVDNGSTDGSVELLRELFPDVELVANGANRGYAVANNQGIARARGRYLLLLNSDTQVQAGAFTALVEYADQHPTVGVMGPRLLNPDGTLQPSGGRFPTPGSTIASLLTGHRRYGTQRDYSVPAEVDEVSGAAMLIARKLIDQVGGLDEGFAWGYEDVDFCLRARRAGWGVHYVPAAEVVHEWGASKALAPAATTVKAIDGRKLYFQKHYGNVQAGMVMGATLASHVVRLLAFSAGGLRSRALHERARTERDIVRALIGPRR